jgi:hypothetical protein
MDRRNNILYNRWFKLKVRNLLDTDWLVFENFIRDVPKDASKLLRVDKTKPHSKSNSKIYLKTDEPVQERKNRIQREHRQKRPDLYKGYSLKKGYGISLETYNEMLEQQGHVCAICGKPEQIVAKGRIKALAVDHNHATGEVRGLLCQACNKALGLLQDDVSLFTKSIQYLQRK